MSPLLNSIQFAKSRIASVVAGQKLLQIDTGIVSGHEAGLSPYWEFQYAIVFKEELYAGWTRYIRQRAVFRRTKLLIEKDCRIRRPLADVDIFTKADILNGTASTPQELYKSPFLMDSSDPWMIIFRRGTEKIYRLELRPAGDPIVQIEQEFRALVGSWLNNGESNLA